MPSSHSTAGDLEHLYAHRFSARERIEKAKLWRILCDDFFSRYVPPDATILDLGAGYCDFINNVRGARKIAVDLNAETVRAAASDVEVLTIDLERIAELIEPETVDLVFASNVFEHLRGPDSLLAVLAAVHRVLRPGGRIVVTQPNVGPLGAAFWDFIDHTLPLTEKGMAEAMGITGFEVIESRARFLPYTTKSRLPKWSVLVRAYIRLRPAHWFFGKQMLIVARKPGP
ncbi:MAG: class SAM-dependent methyltransferase [Planctomycetota bacterium]|nr:class SAM-dependent methyltransferase [Planctomycetota bacterium]